MQIRSSAKHFAAHQSSPYRPRHENILCHFVFVGIALEQPSRQEAEQNWAVFQADPEWQKVKAESEKNGPLVEHIDRYFMDAASFSALQ